MAAMMLQQILATLDGWQPDFLSRKTWNTLKTEQHLYIAEGSLNIQVRDDIGAISDEYFHCSLFLKPIIQLCILNSFIYSVGLMVASQKLCCMKLPKIYPNIKGA